MGNIESLPKWAQRRIADLERKNNQLATWVAEKQAGDDPWPDSDVAWEYGIVGHDADAHQHTIKPHARVVFFRHNPGQQIQAYIDSDGRLNIQGERRIVIRPIASNCAYIEVDPT